MSTPNPLAAHVGRWQGTNRLLTPWTTPAEHLSDATADVALVADGRYATVTYTWAYEGRPCEGFLLVGREPKGDVAHASWVDSWHQGAFPLKSVGTAPDERTLDVRGSYPAPEGPDWGWRTVVEAPDDATLLVTMYNVTPDGEEMPAVECRYVRAATA